MMYGPDLRNFPKSRWRLYAEMDGLTLLLHEVVFGLPVGAAFVIACCAPEARRRLLALGYPQKTVQAARVAAARDR